MRIGGGAGYSENRVLFDLTDSTGQTQSLSAPTITMAEGEPEPLDAVVSTGQPFSNLQPSLTLLRAINLEGVYPTANSALEPLDPLNTPPDQIGAMRTFAFNFAPRGMATTQGQLLSIAQNTALYSLLGTTYGGDGVTTFMLPNEAARLSAGMGSGPGLSSHILGQKYGGDTISLASAQLPSSLGGGNQPIANSQASLSMNYLINVTGPSSPDGSANMLGAIWEFGGSFTPSGWLPCDGRLLLISQNANLFAVLGTNYGGDGITTFALPDLRGRVPIGAGQGYGLTDTGPVGTKLGTETATLTTANLPTNMGGTGASVSNMQPALVINYIIALQGLFPSRNAPLEGTDPLAQLTTEYVYVGEVIAFAGTTLPPGFAYAQGQILSIAQNTALFSLLGTTYGGNGQTTFALPDLRGRAIMGSGTGTTLGQMTGTETMSLNSFNIPSLNYSGTNGADTLYGSDNDDVINGGGGNDTLRGNNGDDTLNGGDGDDIFYFKGSQFDANDKIDGGPGINDTLVLQGSQAVTLGANSTVGIEGISLQSGSVTKWGDTSNALYSYWLTTVDANAVAGQQLRINGQSLRLGEDLWFDGSAETNGRFLVYGGFGTETLTGGAGNDIFYFEAGRFGASDRVNGGAGIDAVVLSGTPSGSTLTVTIGFGQFTSIEVLSFNARFASDPTSLPSYNVTLSNGNIAAGGNLIVNASSLGAGQSLTFNGSAEGSASFTMYGGAGNDSLRGGGGADMFFAAGGADTLTGGSGADRFRYDSVADSTPGAFDTITDFQSGVDKIDLTLVDAIASTGSDDGFTYLGSAAFSNVAGQLRADYNAGTGAWTVQGDVNGDGVADLQILVYSPSLTSGDFLL